MVTAEGVEIKVGQIWTNSLNRRMRVIGWEPREEGTRINIEWLDGYPGIDTWRWEDSFTDRPGDYRLVEDTPGPANPATNQSQQSRGREYER